MFATGKKLGPNLVQGYSMFCLLSKIYFTAWRCLFLDAQSQRLHSHKYFISFWTRRYSNYTISTTNENKHSCIILQHEAGCSDKFPSFPLVPLQRYSQSFACWRSTSRDFCGLREFRDGGWRENSGMSSRSCALMEGILHLEHETDPNSENPSRICCSHELVTPSSVEYECPCQQTEPGLIVAVCSSAEEEAVNLDIPACQQRLVTEKMDGPEMMDAAWEE